MVINKSMLDTLINIPHLDLGYQFDTEKMLKEVESINKFAAYQSTYNEIKELYAENWSGASIVSIDGSVFGDMEELKVYPTTVPKKTKLAEKCPYLVDVLKTLKCENERSRIMRIAPKGHLDWHSHVLHHRQNKERLVVQIPIYVPKGFTYSVVHSKDLNKIKKKQFAKTYDMEYKAGRAYVFNSFHPHNVFNPSNEYRVTLMTYMNFNNAKDILSKAIETYDGPILQSIS